MKTFFTVFFLLLNIVPLFAQLPNTKLFLFQMEQVTDKQYNFTDGKYLTNFNPKGYNNQPHFMSDNILYLTTQFAEDTAQTEIVSLNLKNKILTQITASTDSEYSPTRIPSGQSFSCVRVESDGNNTQRLWQFPLDRSDNGSPLLEEITNVGYHLWLNKNKLILFIVGEPHSLLLADIKTGNQKVITGNIGRGFGKLPNGNLLYISKTIKDRWMLMEYDLVSERRKTFLPTLSGSEDFTILQDGTVLMATGSKLFKFNKEMDTDWVEIEDFGYLGIFNITRLTTSRDGKLVMVAE